MDGNWAGSIMNLLDRIIKLIILNVLWFLFTIVGLVIFSFMPATASVYMIIRKWMNGENLDNNVFLDFWKHFKANFVKTNLVGLVFLIIGCFFT